MTDDKTISKTLSYWLRHRPDAGGLTLDANGWTGVDAVLAALMAEHGADWDRLVSVVETNDKQRFEFSDDFEMIRARQGHSVEVDLALEPLTPPDRLFHGTVEKFLDAIRAEGLKKMRRHHVHLSKDEETATRVGARRGKPVILTVDAAAMARDGHVFYRSNNGVWLTDVVPPRYLAG